MTTLLDLPWLLPAPPDFRSQFRALKAGPIDGRWWAELVALSNHALDDVQLNQLANLLDKTEDAPGLPPRLTLALLGGGTLALVAPAIAASAARRGLRLRVLAGDYGNAIGEALDPASAIRAATPDLALLAFDRHMLGLAQWRPTGGEAERAVGDALATVRTVAGGLRASVRGAILAQTVPHPPEPLLGSADAGFPGSPYALVQAFNARLIGLCAAEGLVPVDIARLAATVGLERWDDPGRWHQTKLPLSPDALPLYGDAAAGVIAATQGRARKCLVLDLDDTLWGGVIGDDGLGGIRLGQGSAEGEAFLAIQRFALQLAGRGVILAVSSKNEEAAARAPFREHPDMLLREHHIAAFQANWTDKAANLRAIAAALNIGLDALVLLDDNPAERAQVRAELPMVAVPELPADPALFPRTLAAAGYFETIRLETEDLSRAGYYAANAARASLQAEASDLDGYLRSLDMVCTIRPFDADGGARIAQLVNKSNQFNLTTRRYTEVEIGAFAGDPLRHTLQVRLADRLGDNGMISVVIADKGAGAWTIDSWLMSCRVIGRRVEEAVLAELVTAARAAGAARLVGRYRPTAKNAMVRDHFRRLGFALVADADAGDVTTWTLTLADYTVPELPMRIARA